MQPWLTAVLDQFLSPWADNTVVLGCSYNPRPVALPVPICLDQYSAELGSALSFVPGDVLNAWAHIRRCGQAVARGTIFFMSEQEAQSPAAASENSGTADDLLERLLECDGQLADLLRTASQAILTLAPGQDGPPESFDTYMQQWFTTLNVRTRVLPSRQCCRLAILTHTPTGHPTYVATCSPCASTSAASSHHVAGRCSGAASWRGWGCRRVAHTYINNAF